MLCLWMTSGASINIEAIPRFVAWAGETKPDQGLYAWSGFSHPWEGEAGGGRSPARFALVVEGNPGLLAVLAPEAGQPEALLLRVVVACSSVPRGPVRPHARSCIQREGRKSRPQRQSTERSAAWERWISWCSRRQRRRGRPTAPPGTRLSTGQGRTLITVRSPQQIL